MAKLKPSVLELKDVPADPVLEARVRARRRLIGAAILLGMGLIGFPIVFKTQPRSVDLAIPISIPDAAKISDPAFDATPSAASREIKLSLQGSSDTSGPDIAAETLRVGSTPKSNFTSTERTDPTQVLNEIKSTDSVPTAAVNESKFVLQAGAFTDVKAVRDLRRKIEASGLKTYTQEVQIKGVTQIRVRLGPFVNREDAAKAQKKLKTLGLSPALLTL